MLLRLRVRIRHRKLDSLIADGVLPATDPELELRARQLARPAVRATVARALRRAMRAVEQRQRGEWQGARVPVAAASVRQCMPELRELARGLTDIRPGIRGVAIASLLVTDGSGPLYANLGAERLRDVVLAAQAWL
jgi:hypothetical protein